MTDPTLLVSLRQVSLDFYFFSLDRFIRFMTATYDLSVPVELSVGPDGLTPGIANIGVTNGAVTNSQLLREAPATLSSAISGLLSGIVGQELGSAIKPINLNSSLASLGIELTHPRHRHGPGLPRPRQAHTGERQLPRHLRGLRARGHAHPGAPPAQAAIRDQRRGDP